MFRLAITNLIRRPLRTVCTLTGLAVSVCLLACLLSFGTTYEVSMHQELDRMGMQMMLVPLGCPYDAAARVLKGRALDVTLPEAALTAARADRAVAVAAPMYTAALPRPEEGRTDLWTGIDDTTRTLKPWWKLTSGSHWFRGGDEVILGSDAAAMEMRRPGDKFYSPETRTMLTVCGVLERSGTSDDNLFFVPLATAQRMFHQPGRLTAIAVRLKDPTLISGAADRLQQIPGAQVVTMAEMMGTFLNLVGAARTLVLAIAAVAVTISVLGIFNTMMAATLERTRELAVLRAVGFHRSSLFGLMTVEAVLLSATGAVLGLLLAALLGGIVEQGIRPFLPLAPTTVLSSLTFGAVVQCVGVMLLAGPAAGLYPAWQVSRLRPAAALTLE